MVYNVYKVLDHNEKMVLICISAKVVFYFGQSGLTMSLFIAGHEVFSAIFGEKIRLESCG
jgi:hypothetical protein